MLINLGTHLGKEVQNFPEKITFNLITEVERPRLFETEENACLRISSWNLISSDDILP